MSARNRPTSSSRTSLSRESIELRGRPEHGNGEPGEPAVGARAYYHCAAPCYARSRRLPIGLLVAVAVFPHDILYTGGNVALKALHLW